MNKKRNFGKFDSAESLQRRRDKSMCSLLLTDNMLLKPNACRQNQPTPTPRSVIWKVITEPFLIFACWNIEAQGTHCDGHRGLEKWGDACRCVRGGAAVWKLSWALQRHYWTHTRPFGSLEAFISVHVSGWRWQSCSRVLISEFCPSFLFKC